MVMVDVALVMQVLVVMLLVMAMITVVQVLVFLVDGQTNSHKRVSSGEL